MAESRRLGGCCPVFDPAQSEVVRSPVGQGPGYWVGAPGAFYDPETRRFWLTYRVREPRPVRGGITRIAVSDDGRRFDDVAEFRKEQFDSDSIERCALQKGFDGVWRWYVSYVDPATSQWRIDLVEADRPEAIDPAARRPVFTTGMLPGIDGVKDPWLFVLGRLYYMISSIGLSVDVDAAETAKKHATGDIFNTGLTISSTGLAVSADGVDFTWLGVTDTTRGPWDRYCFRVNSLLYTPPVFTAFYDGSADVQENYEEKCGLAQSLDLRSYQRISTNGPAITVPHGSTSVRYVDALPVREKVFFYFEQVRPDGSHELRVAVS